MYKSASFKSKNKVDPIKLESECQVRDQLQGQDQLRVERVESAIGLYFLPNEVGFCIICNFNL